MKRKKLMVAAVIVCVILSFTACSKECKNGCGNPADPHCMADMCDRCCGFWTGLNGCYADH